MAISKLPQGWVGCELKNIAKEIISGSGFPKIYQGNKIGDYPFAKVGDISKLFRNKKKTIDSAENYINEDVKDKIKGKIFPANTIVFPKIGEALKGNYRLITRKKMLFDNNVMGIVFSNNINILFLYYFLVTQDFGKFSVATTIPSIQKGCIEGIKINLPPLNEQRRIVEKIEEEFGKIDEGVEKLRFALEQIKQYRQAVLKSAFDGKLYKTTEWKEKSLQELTLKIGDVDHKMPKEVKEGVPYISPKDFYGVNGIDFINAKKITKKDYKILSKKIAPNYGDIIFPRYGTIGTLRYVDTEEQFLVSYSCVVIKTINEKAESKYLYYSLLSPQIKSQIQRSIRQTTQANIGIQSIKDFKIKIGIKAEQQQIVKEIEKRLKVADRLEAVIRQNLDKAEQLKQSILKKAFEGRLVPQDPNDEPASVLLEKIKAERKNKCLIS